MTLKDRLALSAYIEMLDEEIDLRNDSIGMRGGDPVRILLSEYDKLRAQLEGAVVVPEIPAEVVDSILERTRGFSPEKYKKERISARITAWFRENAHSVPASRVLRDGEVAVDARELAALRNLFSAAGNTIANIRNGATIAEINDAWAGVCSAQIMRSQEGGA